LLFFLTRKTLEKPELAEWFTSCSDALNYLEVSNLHHFRRTYPPNGFEVDDFTAEDVHGFVELEIIVA